MDHCIRVVLLLIFPWLLNYAAALLRNLYLVSKLPIMNSKQVDYYSKLKTSLFSDQRQKITYSFNEVERTILGIMREKEDFIYLYEYRGQYIGVEFFISFSKKSV